MLFCLDAIWVPGIEGGSIDVLIGAVAVDVAGFRNDGRQMGAFEAIAFEASDYASRIVRCTVILQQPEGA